MSKVLLVEDNPIHQAIISAILKTNGLSVVIASDGVEALEKVRSTGPDLIILDILMPRMNGYEVCRRLKGNEKTQKIAVVMFSTKSGECDFFWGCKQGADAYVSKLSDLQELVDTVKHLLEGNLLAKPWQRNDFKSGAIASPTGYRLPVPCD